MQQDLQALLFDVDGTLADTEEVHRQAFNMAFKAAGLDWYWSEELYHGLLKVTGGRERIRFYLQRDRPGFELPEDADGFIAGLHQHKTVLYTGMLADGRVPLRPGVERLIREASDTGLRLAVVTTTTLDNVTALFKHSFSAGKDDWFDVVAAGNIVPQKKPAPDIYNYALEKLGLAAGQCLAIEDSANGLHSAQAAGVKVLVTVNRYTEDHDFPGAALVVNHLGDPGTPCKLIKGDISPGPVIDVEFLRRLHAG